MPRKAKKCPEGLLCLRIKIRHIALLILLLAIFFIFLIHNKNKNKTQPSQGQTLISNFNNINSNNKKKNNTAPQALQKISNNNSNLLGPVSNLLDSLSQNNNNVNLTHNETNHNVEEKECDLEAPPTQETTNITINYQLPTDTSTSTYLINKDYERVINPLEPPERRNFYMQPTGLERVMAPRGVPINIPTRGYSGGVMQVGILHKEEVSDDSKKIGQNTEPVILPLFGRQTYNGSNKWSYYTSTDKMNQIKIPISNKNRVCNSEYGCDELYDGDTVSVPAYNGDFKVSIYEYDKPRYIPYV